MAMVERAKARALITKHEGMRAVRYQDTRGIWTIGKGFNLEAPGARQRVAAAGLDYDALMEGQAITEAQADALMEGALENACDAACMIVRGFTTLPEAVQLVLIDMLFNLGSHGFAQFHRMLAAVESGDWLGAAAQMRNSVWFTQVGVRGRDDEELMESAANAA